MSVRYTKDHEWIRLDGNVATVGISAYAAEKLGDVVYVELPQVGAALTKGQAMGAVDSSKAASDVFAPVSGEVIEVNLELNNPDDDQRVLALKKVEDDAEGAGWFIKMKPTSPADLDTLMDAAAYAKYVKGLD